MNAYQLSLIDNPPPKCPYFTLPDVSNFLTTEDPFIDTILNPSRYNSLIQLFGQIETMSDDQQTQFLLQILRYCVEFKPDFEAVADALNIANSNHVTRRFKTILQKQGFTFDEHESQIKGTGTMSLKMQPPRTPAANGKGSTQRGRLKSGTKQSTVGKRAIPRKRYGDDDLSEESPVKKKANLGLFNKRVADETLNSSEDDAEADFEDDDFMA